MAIASRSETQKGMVSLARAIRTSGLWAFQRWAIWEKLNGVPRANNWRGADGHVPMAAT